MRETFYLSSAVPDPGTGADAAGALPELEEAFRARGRTPRLEFIEDLSPELPPLLEAHGWRLTERIPVLICEPAELQQPDPPAGVAIESFEPDSPPQRIRRFMLTQREAFDDDEPITDEEIARWARRGTGSVRVAATSGEEVLGTAVALPQVDGVIEIVGVATLPAHRRRGIAGAVTADATARAFAAGAQVAWLSAADEAAARIYQRAGYRIVATQVGYNAD